MKVKILAALALISAFATVNAGDYLVYKNQVSYERYWDQNSKTGKADKIKLEAYTIINTKRFDDAFIEGEEAPVRVVYIKGSVAKKSGVTLDKGVKGVFIDPTALDEYYGDDLADQYLQWAGDWDVAMYSVNGFYMITEFLGVVTEKAAANSADALSGKPSKKINYPTQFKGVSAAEVGELTTTGTTTTIDAIVYISKGTAKLKYDKKTSELVADYTTGELDDAVAAVMDYLVEKKYASTWD